MCAYEPGSAEEIRKGCVAAAARILAAKWTPQLVYALCHGTQRFCELQKEVGGVNPRTLSARLGELETHGIIKKVSFADVPPRVEYSLTAKGRDLVPILERMVEWGEKHPHATSHAHKHEPANL